MSACVLTWAHSLIPHVLALPVACPPTDVADCLGQPSAHLLANRTCIHACSAPRSARPCCVCNVLTRLTPAMQALAAHFGEAEAGLRSGQPQPPAAARLPRPRSSDALASLSAHQVVHCVSRIRALGPSDAPSLPYMHVPSRILDFFTPPKCNPFSRNCPASPFRGPDAGDWAASGPLKHDVEPAHSSAVPDNGVPTAFHSCLNTHAEEQGVKYKNDINMLQMSRSASPTWLACPAVCARPSMAPKLPRR